MAAPLTSAAASRPRRWSRRKLNSLWVYAGNALFVGLFLLPWVLAISISLLPASALRTYPPTIFSWPLNFGNYLHLLQIDDGRFISYLRTSALVAAVTSVSVSVVSGMAGYALARLQFAGKETIFIFILGTMMFPFTAVLIPLFAIMSRLHMINNPLTLVILYTVFQTPFCTFLFRNSFEAIPGALRDAALIDGCGELGVLRRVMLPLAKPAFATVLIYSFYQSWNEFTAALIFLTDETTTTVPVGLTTLLLSGRFASQPNYQMVGAVLSFLPILVIFLAFQRFFVKGLIAGSTKG